MPAEADENGRRSAEMWNKRKLGDYHRLVSVFMTFLTIFLMILWYTAKSPRDGVGLAVEKAEYATAEARDVAEGASSSSSSSSSSSAVSDNQPTSELLRIKGNHNVVFYNRVPKCASKTVRLTFHDLATMNGFTAYSSEIFNVQRITDTEQQALVKEIYAMKQPLTFDRHIYFIDFTQFNMAQPVYINVVRDPVTRFVSSYYYLRYRCMEIPATCPKSYNLAKAGNTTIDECVQEQHPECSNLWHIVPYFCGQDPLCKRIGDWSLDKAKANLLKYYTVVGLSEELDKFFFAIEKLLPRYFKDVTKVLSPEDRHENTYKANYKVPPSAKTVEILKGRMKEEYQFYDWVKQRFERQYEEILKM